MKARTVNLYPGLRPELREGEEMEIRQVGDDNRKVRYMLKIIRFLDGGYSQLDIYGCRYRLAECVMRSGNEDDWERTRVWFTMHEGGGRG